MCVHAHVMVDASGHVLEFGCVRWLGDTDMDYWELKGWLEELLMLWTDGQKASSWWGLRGALRPIKDGGPDGVSKVNQGPCGTSGRLF